MAKKQGSLDSPFESALIPSEKDATGGATLDRNMCPVFGKPRESGPTAQREVFGVGVKGKNYHGKITGNAAVSSPMGNMKKG